MHNRKIYQVQVPTQHIYIYWPSPPLLSDVSSTYEAHWKKCSVSGASHFMSLRVLNIGTLTLGSPHGFCTNSETLLVQSLL